VYYSKKLDINSLLERAKSGDERAFEEIYTQCSGYVSFVCSKIHNDKEDIEEIIQDTFADIFKRIDEIRGDTFFALLKKIAANKCYSKYRSEKKHDNNDSISEDYELGLQEIDPNLLPEEYLQKKELSSELLLIVNALPPKQRGAIYLYYYVGMSTEEIAALRGVPSLNIRKAMHDARKNIKTKIEQNAKLASAKLVGKKVVSSITLASFLHLEAEAFMASYVPPNFNRAAIFAGGTATIIAKGATTIAPIGYLVTAGVAATCAITISAILYLGQPQGYEVPFYPEPEIYSIYAPLEMPHQTISHETEYIENTNEEYFEDIYTEDASEIEIPEPEPYIPHEAQEEPPEPIVSEPLAEEHGPYEIAEYYEEVYELQEIFEEPEEPQEYYMVYGHEEDFDEEEAEIVYEEEPDMTYEEEEAEPIVIDRTPEILAALSLARNSSQLNQILNNYSFALRSQAQDSHGLQFNFWVLEENGDSILVGVATYSDGSSWRMQFEHFPNSQIPQGTFALFDWMEQ